MASFNPRTSIRYDPIDLTKAFLFAGFNPRTSIRYDVDDSYTDAKVRVSTHVPL